VVAAAGYAPVKQTFLEKLMNAEAVRSSFALYISPQMDKLPPEFQRYDDPFLPYMRSVYAATEDLVCAYVFGFASYLAIGAAGMIALERSIALAAKTHITILDARFATADYACVWGETALGCDAVTITTEAPLLPFQTRLDRQAFTVTNSEAFPARCDFAKGLIVFDQHTLPLLPLDTLDRARSLTFEDTIRNIVRDYVSA
jgi:hypothetical protein